MPNLFTSRRFSDPDYSGLDGELILGHPFDEGVYLRTHSAVMTQGGSPDVTMYVFDDFTHPSDTFEDRWVGLKTRVASFDNPNIQLLEQYWVENQDELTALEEDTLNLGYEGLILRAPSGKYKYGRSTETQGWMLKLKRFADSEAIILGFIEGMSNQNSAQLNELGLTERSSHKENQIPTGSLGSLRVRDVHRGWQFEIGTGFTEAQRQEIWGRKSAYIGTIVKYQYFPIGMKDSPRFPSYRGPRSLIDL